MEHSKLPEYCGELVKEREAMTQNLASAALYLCSVNDMYLTEQFLGQVSDETKDQANEAGKRYNEAITGLLDVNRRINEIA